MQKSVPFLDTISYTKAKQLLEMAELGLQEGNSKAVVLAMKLQIREEVYSNPDALMFTPLITDPIFVAKTHIPMYGRILELLDREEDLVKIELKNGKSLDYSKFDEAPTEESEPKVKPSLRAIALYYVFRIEKGIELPFDERTPNKTKAIKAITTERNIDESTFRRELKIANNPNKRKNIKYEGDYKQAIQLLNEDKHTNKEAIILAQNELKIFAPLG